METHNNKEERKEKIKALRLQEKRNKELPHLLNSVSLILRRELSEKDLLTLAEIEQHSINLNSTDFNFNYLNICFPRQDVSQLRNRISSLLSELSQTNYMTLSQWMDISVLKINTGFVIDAFEKLIELDKNTFYIHDLEYQNGLWIDLYSDCWYLNGQTQFLQILELRVFGEKWIKKVVCAF